MLKPGGKMLYSTCTFSKLEDEESIRHLLKNRPCMKLIDIKPYEGFRHGFVEDEEDKELQLDKSVRIWPHIMQGEGHFVALFEKSYDAEGGNYVMPLPDGKSKIPEELETFINLLEYKIDKKDIEIIDNRVFVIPRVAGDMKKLRKLRTGLLLGELKKNRFEPSQALAMVLKKNEYPYTVDLSVSDGNVIKYLKGETIDIT